MGKNNRLTDGAFGPLMGNEDPQKFLMADDELGIEVTPEIEHFKELYSKLLNKNKDDLENLAKLEETITQLRCKEVAKKDFKLSQVRGYIYARTPFFRNGNSIKDIRAIVGKTSEYGTDLDALFANKIFVRQAREKLQLAITNEMKDNMIFINSLEEKIF